MVLQSQALLTVAMSSGLDRYNLHGPRHRPQPDRLPRHEARITLPSAHFFDRPRARLARECEIEIEQGAYLTCVLRRRRARQFKNYEYTTRFQRVRDFSSEFAIGRFVEVMQQLRDEDEIPLVGAEIIRQGVARAVNDSVAHSFLR